MAQNVRPGVTTERLDVPTNSKADTSFVNVGLIGVGDGGYSIDATTVNRANSGDTDAVDPDMTDAANVQYKGYFYTKDTDFSVAGGDISWSATYLNTPYLISATPKASNYSPIPGVYSYKVTAIKKLTLGTVPTWGETTVSNAKTVTVTTGKCVDLKWVAVPQAEGYRIYRKDPTGTVETLLHEIQGEQTTWTDNGYYNVSATPMPVTNTATRKPPNSVAATSAYWQGAAVTVTAAVAALTAITSGELTFNMDAAGDITMTGVSFAVITGTSDIEKLESAARILTTHASMATGDEAYFISGDCSINASVIRAVTNGVIAVYGDNLLTNGDFRLESSGWVVSAGWTVDGINNEATHTTVTAVTTLANTLAAVVSSNYKLEITVDGMTAGAISVSFGGINYSITADGVYSWTGTASTTAAFTITPTNGFDGSVSNMYVQKKSETASMNFTTKTTLDLVAAEIQTKLQALGGAFATWLCSYSDGKFTITSSTKGRNSRVTVVSPSTGTDLTAITLMDFVEGYEVRGRNSDALATYTSATMMFKLYSATTGTTSSMVVTTTGSVADFADEIKFDTGAQVAGTNSVLVEYTCDATITGANYFKPVVVFTAPDAAKLFGATTELYEYASKALLPPPAGQGAKQMTICAVPAMTRAANQAALTEMLKSSMDTITTLSTDVDIVRDVAAHAVYGEQPLVKKERIAFMSASRTAKVENIVALSAILASRRIFLCFDNASTETNIAPIVAAMQASLPTRSDSIINRALNVDGFLAEPILSREAITYLISQGVLVCDYNDDGVFCVINDVSTLGADDDVVGQLCDDTLRKQLRTRINSFIGKVKLQDPPFDSGVKAIRIAVTTFLDEMVRDQIIAGWNSTSLVVEKSTDQRYKVTVNFTYQRIETLKFVDFTYYVD